MARAHTIITCHITVSGFTDDIHICGNCKKLFVTIEAFLVHKQEAEKCHPPTIRRMEDADSSTDYTAAATSTSTKSVVTPEAQVEPRIALSSSASEQSNTSGSAIQHVLESTSVKEKKSSSHLSSTSSTLLAHLQTTIPRSTGPRKHKTSAPSDPHNPNGNPSCKKFKCEYEGCSYTSAYPKDLQRHVKVHTGERPFKCNLCGKTFNRSDKFKVHERYHSGLKPYKCHQCGYATSDSSSLKKHLRIHSDERPFRCQICQYASRNSSQLVVHLRTHTGDAPFHCTICGTRFKINSDLKRHLRMHTGEKPFKCSHCDYACAIKGNLKTHLRRNHSTDSIQECSQCDFRSSSRKLFRQHEKTHTVKPFHCPHPGCSYYCSSQASLRNHRHIHSDDLPFKCDFCLYTSQQPGNVRGHMKKWHSDQLSAQDKKTKIKRARATNPSTGCAPNCSGNPAEREVSSNKLGKVCLNRPFCTKSFKCGQCDAAFVRADSLRSHVRQHKLLEDTEPISTEANRPSVSGSSNTTLGSSKQIQADVVSTTSSDVTVSSREPNRQRGDTKNQTCMVEQALQQSGLGGVNPNLQSGNEAREVGTSSMEMLQQPRQFLEKDLPSSGTEYTFEALDVTVVPSSSTGAPSFDNVPRQSILCNASSRKMPCASTLQTSAEVPNAHFVYQMQPGIQFIPYRHPSTLQYVFQAASQSREAALQTLQNETTHQHTEQQQHMATLMQTAPLQQFPLDILAQTSSHNIQPQIVNCVWNSGGNISTNLDGSMPSTSSTVTTTGKPLLFTSDQVVSQHGFTPACSTVLVHPGNVIALSPVTASMFSSFPITQTTLKPIDVISTTTQAQPQASSISLSNSIVQSLDIAATTVSSPSAVRHQQSTEHTSGVAVVNGDSTNLNGKSSERASEVTPVTFV